MKDLSLESCIAIIVMLFALIVFAGAFIGHIITRNQSDEHEPSEGCTCDDVDSYHCKKDCYIARLRSKD